MLFYVFIFDIAIMIAFVFWQVEVSVAFLSLLPGLINIWVLNIKPEAKKAIFKYSNGHVWTAFYVLAGLIMSFMIGFAFLFGTTVIAFKYRPDGYYPAVGWGFMNLYLFFACLVNSIYYASVIKLVYDLRKYHN